MKFILRNDSILPRDRAVTDIDDRGYQFGDGVYEVVRLYEGVPFLMEPHLVRLRRSCRELGMDLNFTDESLKERLAELVTKEEVQTGTVYIQITRGIFSRIQEFPPGDLPVQVTAYARGLARPEEKIAHGVRVGLVPDIRWLRCDIKSLNLLPNILARQNVKGSGCYEAVQHRDKVVTEGAFSNVYKISGGTVFTHPEGNLILSGITRAHVLSLCSGAGIPVREEPFSVEDLLAADEVFITSTTNEAMPVVAVGNHSIGDGNPGPLTRKIQALYEESVLSATGLTHV
jgi:D-alanine transaminase